MTTLNNFLRKDISHLSTLSNFNFQDVSIFTYFLLIDQKKVTKKNRPRCKITEIYIVIAIKFPTRNLKSTNFSNKEILFQQLLINFNR